MSSNRADCSSQFHDLPRDSRLTALMLLLFLLLILLVCSPASLNLRAGSLFTRESLLAIFTWLPCLSVLDAFRKTKEGAQPVGEPREPGSADVSAQEREALLEVLSRSQRSYRTLIDSLDLLVFTISLDGRFQVANRPLAELFGVSFPELVQHSFEEFVSEPDRAAAETALPDFLEKTTWSGVIRVRLKKTGEVRYFDMALHAARADGRVTGVSGLARDITDEHLSETRFTELFETLQEGAYFTAPDGTVLDANPALLRMLGYEKREELVGKKATDFYRDPAERSQVLKELDAQGSVRGRLTALVRRDRTPLLCLDSSTAIRDASGRVIRYQGTLVDVTERLEMEKRLRREQEFVRRVMDSIPDIVAVLDTKMKFTFVSPRVEEILGYPPGQLIGHELGERAHPDDLPALRELFLRMLRGEMSASQVEFRSAHADGSWRVLRANASPFLDAEEKIIGVVASARDVTESKQLEQQLQQRERFASFGQMLSGAAHELNNPLTAILGVSDLLRERATDDALRHQVALVHKQARRAADIVQNLLSMARPSPAGRTAVELQQLIPRALQVQARTLAEHKIAVSFEAQPDLPAVEGDSNQLLQLFSNLILNAEQAISSARDSGSLRIRTSYSGEEVTVSFSDDGPGVPPNILGRIFDPFFSTKRPGGGTGLGLTIALAVAKEHGGNIEVRSVEGEGTTFIVRLPAIRRAGIKAQAAPSINLQPLRGLSVLVVDDEESIRELVTEGLSARGMAVESAGTAEEALAILSDHAFDFVLCDYNLPGQSGEALFEELRGRIGGAAMRFIFMTGDLVGKATVESHRSRGARTIQKPFQLSGLAALLSQFLQEAPTAR